MKREQGVVVTVAFQFLTYERRQIFHDLRKGKIKVRAKYMPWLSYWRNRSHSLSATLQSCFVKCTPPRISTNIETLLLSHAV